MLLKIILPAQRWDGRKQAIASLQGQTTVMTFVDGDDLQRRLESQTFSQQQATRLAIEIAKAIADIHDQGIIHSDLKPANVLMDRSGQIVVADFGFAHLRDQSLGDQLVGRTFGFIAPEIWELKQKPTVASDIYAIGVTAWTLFSGRLPEEEIFAETNSGEEISEFETICRTCMQPNKAQRDRNASEILHLITGSIGYALSHLFRESHSQTTT